MTKNYVSFSNAELRRTPTMEIGDTLACPHCGESHKIHGSKREDGTTTNMLMWYRCRETSYLAGVAGKSVVERFQK